jgi:hypothetical protein
MRLIQTADDELFEAVSLAGKLGRAERLVEGFEKRHDEHPDDADAAFSYALALLAVLPTAGSETEAHGRFHAAADALDLVLAAVPDHWLARYLRIRLRCLQVDSRSALRVQADAELGKANSELDELMELQSQAAWQPYFSSVLLLAARLTDLTQQSGPAADRVAELTARAERNPGRRIPFRALETLLREPFDTSHRSAAEPGRRTATAQPKPAPAPETLAGRQLLDETARGLGRLMNYLRVHLASVESPDESGTLPGGAYAGVQSELEETLGIARDLRGGLRSWAAGDADAAERARAAIPAALSAIEGFLTHCEMAYDIADNLDSLSTDARAWLHQEMTTVQEDVERLISLLTRCRDRVADEAAGAGTGRAAR